MVVWQKFDFFTIFASIRFALVVGASFFLYLLLLRLPSFVVACVTASCSSNLSFRKSNSVGEMTLCAILDLFCSLLLLLFEALACQQRRLMAPHNVHENAVTSSAIPLPSTTTQSIPIYLTIMWESAKVHCVSHSFMRVDTGLGAEEYWRRTELFFFLRLRHWSLKTINFIVHMGNRARVRFILTQRVSVSMFECGLCRLASLSEWVSACKHKLYICRNENNIRTRSVNTSCAKHVSHKVRCLVI